MWRHECPRIRESAIQVFRAQRSGAVRPPRRFAHASKALRVFELHSARVESGARTRRTKALRAKL
jgi:hypothetical protein